MFAGNNGLDVANLWTFVLMIVLVLGDVLYSIFFWKLKWKQWEMLSTMVNQVAEPL